jgi:hypothetical protein
VFAHVPPHDVWPLGQAHVDAVHVMPPVHALPHEPQFAALV